MKLSIIFTILGLIFVFGCSNLVVDDVIDNEVDDQDSLDKDVFFCETYADCVPKPGCHARECINKDFEKDFDRPDMCTMLFDCQAAYVAEDCLCVDGKCRNKNADGSGCPEIGIDEGSNQG